MKFMYERIGWIRNVALSKPAHKTFDFTFVCLDRVSSLAAYCWWWCARPEPPLEMFTQFRLMIRENVLKDYEIVNVLVVSTIGFYFLLIDFDMFQRLPARFIEFDRINIHASPLFAPEAWARKTNENKRRRLIGLLTGMLQQFVFAFAYMRFGEKKNFANWFLSKNISQLLSPLPEKRSFSCS